MLCDISVQITIPEVIMATERNLEMVYFFFRIKIPIIMFAMREPYNFIRSINYF